MEKMLTPYTMQQTQHIFELENEGRPEATFR